MNEINVRIGDFDVKWFLLVAEEGAVSLVLDGGGDIFCDGWMGQELIDLGNTHFTWVTESASFCLE